MLPKFTVRKLKHRLFLVFMIFTFNTVLLSGISFYYFHKAENLRTEELKVSRLQSAIKELFRSDLMFSVNEKESVMNPAYSYTSSEDAAAVRNVKKLLKELKSGVITTEPVIDKDLTLLDSIFDEYTVASATYRKAVRERGLKDSGLVGKMRRNAHMLESKAECNPVRLLTLRRHEKDFMLRKDSGYVELFSKEYRLLRSELQNQHAKITGPVIERLDSYAAFFFRLSELEYTINNPQNKGLRTNLLNLAASVEQNFDSIYAATSRAANKKMQDATILFITGIVITLLLSLVMTVFISDKLSRPIRSLALEMDRFRGYSNPLQMPEIDESTEEITLLKNSFTNMAEQLRLRLDELKTNALKHEEQNKKLEKVNSELDRFIYSASHDIRAPLSSLLGLIDITRKQIKTEEYDDYFNMMTRSVYKLESYVKSIVNYGKNRRLDLVCEKVDVPELARDIVSGMQFSDYAAGVHTHVKEDIRAEVFTDKVRLSMLLFNLVSNAYKHRNPIRKNKSIIIDITADKNLLTIEVADNGTGIEKQYLDKIFDIFYKASEKSEGSGLGCSS